MMIELYDEKLLKNKYDINTRAYIKVNSSFTKFSLIELMAIAMLFISSISNCTVSSMDSIFE